MRVTRRQLLYRTGGVGAGLLIPNPAQAAERAFTPEMFGAKGDGRTDDSRAMAALGEAVSANGGGIVQFRRTTYLVGGQTPTGRADTPFAFEPVRLLEFRSCRAPLIIRGNGARIKCAPDLRYGVFDPAGTPLRHAMPYIGPGVASPYRQMILVTQCSAPIEIADLELDGSLDELVIGGGYGDTGWQIATRGIELTDNRGDEVLRAIHSHHHAQDGLLIDGVTDSAARRIISGLRAEYNGRQGCSIVGGQGYRFEDCVFSSTGRSAVSSAPGAGVDIEAEGEKIVRDLGFSDCRFVDNAGPGMVADSGDSDRARFTNCQFVGTSSWSVWPDKPHFRFDGCTFAGALARAFGDSDPERAAQFHHCTFTDDPALAPAGQLYGGSNTDRPLADLAEAKNMLFNRCSFLATHGAVLPWSVNAIYQDCTMVQTSPTVSFPRGRFIGRTTISGQANLSGSRVIGEVIENGRRYANERL